MVGLVAVMRTGRKKKWATVPVIIKKNGKAKLARKLKRQSKPKFEATEVEPYSQSYQSNVDDSDFETNAQAAKWAQTA